MRIKLFLAISVIAIFLPGCKLDTKPDSVPVTGVILDRDVSWSSDNESVVTVDNNGKVTFVNYGRTDITVTTDNGGYTDTCEVIACDENAFITLWTILDSGSLFIPAAMGKCQDA